jgi:hypothetical protein
MNRMLHRALCLHARENSLLTPFADARPHTGMNVWFCLGQRPALNWSSDWSWPTPVIRVDQLQRGERPADDPDERSHLLSCCQRNGLYDGLSPPTFFNASIDASCACIGAAGYWSVLGRFARMLGLFDGRCRGPSTLVT